MSKDIILRFDCNQAASMIAARTMRVDLPEPALEMIRRSLLMDAGLELCNQLKGKDWHLVRMIEVNELGDDAVVGEARHLWVKAQIVKPLPNNGEFSSLLAWARMAYLALSRSTQYINIGEDVLRSAPDIAKPAWSE